MNNNLLIHQQYIQEYLVRKYFPTWSMIGKLVGSKNQFEVMGYPIGESLTFKECGYNIKDVQLNQIYPNKYH